jgi:hypothetical protein
MVFSTFLIHLIATSASCSPIYGLQPISLILLTKRTSSTTLSMVVTFTGAAYRIFMMGAVCVIELAMTSITTLTICTRSLESTYYGGTPVGTVDSCASNLSYSPNAAGGTFSVWLGLWPFSATVFPPRKVSGDILEAWDVVSSKGSLSRKPWAPRPPLLLYKEGGSVCVPCWARIILKFITITSLLMILRIQTKGSDINGNNLAFQAKTIVNLYIYIFDTTSYRKLMNLFLLIIEVQSVH